MARILDNILCTILIFLLTFAWATFCLKNAALALALAAIVSLCGSYVTYVLLKKLENRKSVKKQKKKQLNDFAIYLQFNCDNSELFMKMFNYYNFITEKVNFDNIIATKSERCYVAICFENDAVKLPQLRNAIICAKRNGCVKLLVFGVKADTGALTIANGQFPTKFVDLENAFALFEHSETLPTVPQAKATKQHILPQYAFNKKRFGWYFSGAVFLFLTSFISYFKLYSLLWATALAGVALYCLFNKRYNKIPTDVKLE
ncbi:MAG: hypothetical protein NC132_01815 [Corallococcus sp.]|nr:hypothetical protein [Corallococcus sp.]MCM1359395.1 hypothetical protein [Corallococcus sp.]MCM1394838.1 hypothetical protein [Corallococcus sp.]